MSDLTIERELGSLADHCAELIERRAALTAQRASLIQLVSALDLSLKLMGGER